VDLNFAELSSELDLTIGRKVLRREQQNLIAQPRLIDRAEHLVRNAVRQSYARDLGAEIRCQRPYSEWQSKFDTGVHGL
jgi:hypothetical protein